MEIKKITAYTGFELEKLCDWMYGWWGKSEGYSRESVRGYLLHSICDDRIPQTFGAYMGDELIGIYQIAMNDLFVRPDIYPWLCNVYVDEHYRGHGAAREMLKSVTGSMAALGICELYLFTAYSGLYEKYGWKFLGPIHTYLHDDVQRLYVLRLNGN